MNLKTLLGLLPVIENTTIIYLAIILFLGFFGFRLKTMVSIIELIVALMLGSAVETALIAGNKSLLAGVASVATLLILNRLLSFLLQRSKWLRRLLVGSPKLLFYHGRFLRQNIRKAGLTEEDVEAGFRHHGYSDPDQVSLAVFEVSGEITVIPKDEEDEGGDSEKRKA